MRDVKTMSYGEAIREALADGLEKYPEMILIGEGVPDPKNIFATTEDLREKYGPERVLDMPLAENGMTGICIGAALGGMRPVLVHQRIDFALLSVDQIVNNAAKWHYMFDGQQRVPLVIRVIIGRGWGQGPQHSQSLQAMFAQVPGLRVVMPTTANDAYHYMLDAIADDNPVLFVEHRWLHHIHGEVDKNRDREQLAGAAVLRQGCDITLAAFSQMTVEALKAATVLAEHGIDAEVVDMRCLTPLDADGVARSVAKTGVLLVADCAPDMASVAHNLLSKLFQFHAGLLRLPPRLIAYPNHPVPTSPYMANHYYPGAKEIAAAVLEMLDKRPLTQTVLAKLQSDLAQDLPDRSFAGPF